MKILTVAIPTYNRVRYLPIVLKSILTQIDDTIEILVIDNASTDGTFEYMKKISQLHPEIRYVRNQENIGADGNFLKCYELSSGEYVLLLGSDDSLIKGAIKEIKQYLIEHEKTDFVMLNFNMFDENKGTNQKPYLPVEHNFSISDKNAFISQTGVMLTFMSCIICRTELMQKVKDPKKYVGTNFIHTCMFFEANKGNSCKYGIISKPCVAANITAGNGSEDSSFLVFGNKLHHILCDVGPQFGFDGTLLEEIFFNDVKRNWPGWIINSIVSGKKKTNGYKEYGRPCLDNHVFFRSFLDILNSCPRGLLVCAKKVKNLVSRKHYGKS